MIKNENIKLLVKKFNENKLSHVFLIETNDKVSACLDLKELAKVLNCSDNFSESCRKCNLCRLIDNDSLPTLKIISPDGQAIKKNQMEELKKSFSNLPYLSKYNIYIINDAERFNASSANMMLKFIEEPEDSIIGFLITNNRENVINTIKSRCEIIKANYSTNIIENLNEEIKILAVDYLYKLEVEKQQSILYNKIILDKKLEKEDILDLFKFILKIYLDLLNENFSNDKLNELKRINKQDIVKRIDLVTNIIDRLNYNVNINLLLDYFVLRLED